MAKTGKNYYCSKCKRTMSEESFYSSNNSEKYPNDNKLDQCKKCLTMHVNNWDPKTFLWILQECDVPYIPEEWQKLMARYAKDASKVTGMTILGRYLSKMRLSQYNEYRWKDTEFLQKLAQNRMKEAMENQGYEVQDIAEAIERTTLIIPEGGFKEPDISQYEKQEEIVEQQEEEDKDEEEFSKSLTSEDKIYLKMKWGKDYRPSQWIFLENLYNSMMDSYDIQSAGHIDNLKLLCKASLRSNELMDLGDIEGAQKAARMYDQLMRSGNFTAVQNKADVGDAISSVSQLVSLCEKEGFIPRYYIEEPNDKIDETILDMKNYTKSLITEEMNLENLIEGALKEIQKTEEKENESDNEDISSEELTLEKIEEVKDKDFEEYFDFLEEESNEDKKLMGEERK